MLRLFHLTALLLILFSRLASAETAGRILRHPFYFKITTASGSGPVSHILGTLHGGVDITDLPAFILNDFNQSRNFLTEWRFTDQEIRSIQSGQSIIEKVKNFEHKGQDLTREEKSDLIHHWGIDQRLAAQAKSEDCGLLVFGGEFENGYLDVDLLEKAINDKKNITALDTQEYFDKLKAQIEKLPACDIRPIMKNYDPEVLKTAQLEMIKQYRAGNAEALSAEGITMTQERNEIWLPVLSESLSKQNTFIAVGAGHLFGPHGLVELLRNSGFNVEPDGE